MLLSKSLASKRAFAAAAKGKSWVQPNGYKYGFIDMRSDTVTRPCDKMRDAMANSIVGDDMYDDCPTTLKF